MKHKFIASGDKVIYQCSEVKNKSEIIYAITIHLLYYPKSIICHYINNKPTQFYGINPNNKEASLFIKKGSITFYKKINNNGINTQQKNVSY